MDKRMSTQYQIRKVFTQHWCEQKDQPGKNVWLIQGDFDHFKLTNDLYGSMICDTLLDWSLEVIETELQAYHEIWGQGDALWNFIGDDVTIYIPPCELQDSDIEQLLWHICKAIERSFYRRYRVAALPFSPGFFDDVSLSSLEGLRSELERMEIVFDFARRHRGYLILFPVEEDGVYSPVIEQVLRVIQRCAGKRVPPVEIDLDWICGPQDQLSRAFNEGFLQPPSISFAACSMGMGMEEKSVPDRRSIYERVSLACQSALKRCKLQRQRVVIQKAEPVAVEPYLTYQPAGMLEVNSALRWPSERYLRETLYFQQLDQPVLFQFNPVYRSTSPWYASMMVDEALAMEKYRGNKYGIGLKGINEIFGHNAATRLIGELMGVFSKTMQATLVDRRLPTERIHIARFVDRFTICCEQPYLQLPEIIELVQRLSRLFNCLSEEIKISHLRTSVVFGGDCSVGYRLFQKLAHVSLSSQATAVENSDPPIEVRQSRFASCEEQGRITLERNSFLSANLLDSYL